MKIKGIIISCLILTPIIMGAIPAAIPSASSEPIPEKPSYALDFAAPRTWNDNNKYNDITYVTFYTFFKCGIDPDCIDIVDESKEKLTWNTN